MQGMQNMNHVLTAYIWIIDLTTYIVMYVNVASHLPTGSQNVTEQAQQHNNHCFLPS